MANRNTGREDVYAVEAALSEGRAAYEFATGAVALQTFWLPRAVPTVRSHG
jgi:hypothetical protein